MAAVLNEVTHASRPPTYQIGSKRRRAAPDQPRSCRALVLRFTGCGRRASKVNLWVLVTAALGFVEVSSWGLIWLLDSSYGLREFRSAIWFQGVAYIAVLTVLAFCFAAGLHLNNVRA